MKKLFLFFSIFFITVFGHNIFAQADGKTIYNNAVDQINCKTIKFIHTEAGRPQVANGLECFSFEGIMQSIPVDEGGTTGKLARDIEAYKAKYTAGAALESQIQDVIDLAVQRVRAKPRKQDVDAFANSLEEIKNEALSNYSDLTAEHDEPAGNTDNTEAEEVTTPAGGVVMDDEEQLNEDEAAENPTSILTWVILGMALLGVGLGLYALLLVKRIPAAGLMEGAGNKTKPEKAETESNAAITELVVRLRQTETRLSEEMKRLSDEVNEKLAAVTASTGYTTPVSFSQENDEPERPATPIDTSPEHAIEEEMIETTGHAHQAEQETRVNTGEQEVPVANTIMREDSNSGEERPEEATEEEVEEGDVLFEYDSNTEAKSDLGKAPFAKDDEDGTSSLEKADILVEDDETPATNEQEAETTPYYLYAGLPEKDGSFHDNDLMESPDNDAIYEIELYEDVPNKAFISLLPYPDLIKKMIQDPETYLASCCEYEGDPSGKHTIVLLEEGILTRKGDIWAVDQKAKVRFE